MEISQDEAKAFAELKKQIEQKMLDLEILQRKYRGLTGRAYVMPLYLTDPVNRATLEPNP